MVVQGVIQYMEIMWVLMALTLVVDLGVLVQLETVVEDQTPLL